MLPAGTRAVNKPIGAVAVCGDATTGAVVGVVVVAAAVEDGVEVASVAVATGAFNPPSVVAGVVASVAGLVASVLPRRAMTTELKMTTNAARPLVMRNFLRVGDM
jgi:hypothetical protein